MATNVKVGTYTGNGSAQNISLGFIPDYVEIINTTTPGKDEWMSNFSAGTSFTAATDTVAANIRANPNGVSVFAGSLTAAAGFTVGAGLSTNAAVYRFIAIANGPGAQ